jgi:DME family drug/metabolite transporter
MYGATFFAAVYETGVAVGTVVALGSAPILTGVLSAVLFRSLPTRTWMLATAVAIAGMSLIVLSGNDTNVSAIGILYALGAGLGYAFFALASKRIVESGVASDIAMARVFGIAAIMLAPALLFVNTEWVLTTGGISLGLWLGVITVAIAYWAYASGLKNLEPRETTMITLAEPVVATILGAVVLDERPAALAWFGIIIVMTVELGLIHPPVGMNVFVIKSVVHDVSFMTIFKGVIPFVLTDLLRLVILIAFPIIALWLPERMG